MEFFTEDSKTEKSLDIAGKKMFKISFNIRRMPETYSVEFESGFRDRLQENSQLLNSITLKLVLGDKLYIKDPLDIKVYDENDETNIFEDWANIIKKGDGRLLKPKLIGIKIPFDKFNMIKRGAEGFRVLAKRLADLFVLRLNQEIIKGIKDFAYSEKSGIRILSGANETGIVKGDSKTKCIHKYDQTQTIAWNDNELGDHGNRMPIMAGFNADKLLKAQVKVRSKIQNCNIVSLLSHYAKAQFTSDRLLIMGLKGRELKYFGGCNEFITSELLDRGKSVVRADGKGTDNVNGKDVEYAYVFAKEQVVLGYSGDLQVILDSDTQTAGCMLKCDCTRLSEDAVVRVENAKDLIDVKEDSFLNKNTSPTNLTKTGSNL